jgi:two-component system CheB/CheR fusion protein
MADPEIALVDPPVHVPICAIGASAGGVAALKGFFSLIGDDLGLAYVVIVHLAPDHPSAMSEILASCTRMPVQQVNDAPKLQPNCIYVIPPDRELVIEGDDVAARPFSEPRGQRAPIDMFFRSVAAGRGDGLAVVLSGSGADGSLGVRAIKESGGVVFAQDPADAEYSMMPQNAIATGAADFVAPIPELVERLTEVARSRDAVRSLGADDAANELRRIIGFLRARTGYDFSGYKRATVIRRIARRMQVTRRPELTDYAEYLRDAPEEAQHLFGDLLISVTAFFRDPRAFEVLAEQAIKPLFDEVNEEDGIRAWVVGCATGEEAYSIAMLLLEEATRRKVKFPIQVFASDLDEGALATAREGRYPRSIEADVSEERLKRFFVQEGSLYRVRAELRELVLFTKHSALSDPPFLHLDLVTCRNLLIYLERALQGQLGRLVHYGLRPGRYLFLGSAETIDVVPELFEAVDREARIYRARSGVARTLPLPSEAIYRPRLHQEPPRQDFPHLRDRSAASMHLAALERGVPPSVLVDNAQRIVNLSPTAGRFILHSAGPITAELPAIVRPELRLDVRTGLERALQQQQPTVTLPIPVAFNGTAHRVVVHVMPLPSEEHSAVSAVVFFLDGGEVETPTEPATNAASTDSRRLHDELKAAREWLDISRNEHETAIQDLRAANEELQSINEEYRSTSEELETSKEELQSMNEELQTVKAELKAKLASIATAHSDLQNLTAATEIGTLFLDPELRIRMFTPPVAALFNITEGDAGRAITDFTHRLAHDGVELAARRVLRDLTPVETEVATTDGRWYMMRLRPYRTIEDRIDGIVVTFVDVTQRIEAERELRASEERYRLLFDSIDEGFSVIEMIYDDAGEPSDFRFIDVNAAFERQTGIANALGKTIRSIAPAHEESWFEIYGRIAATGQPERFENAAAALGHYYEVYAFRVGSPDERRVGVLFNDISERKQAELERELLTAELSHRVKNLLGVVQALAMQTNGDTDSVAEFRDAFVGRLRALGRAHNLLVGAEWRGADLRRLVEETVAIYDAERRKAVEVDGDPVPLTPKQALGLSLVLHELSTNAIKYGAFSNSAGHISVSWRVVRAGDASKVLLRWRERDGPSVASPGVKGFGTRLVERAIGYDLDGDVKLDYAESGLTCEITFPVA